MVRGVASRLWAVKEAGRRRCATLAAAAAGLVLCGPAARAEEPESFQVWSGFAAQTGSQSGYAGLVHAPFGTIADDGWRLRVEGRVGRYTYVTTSSHPLYPVISHYGDVTTASLLAGVQTTFGATTAKTYLGLDAGWRREQRTDGRSAAEQRVGAKLVLETWTELGPDAFLALDGAWSTAGPAGGATLRAGWRLTDDLAGGPEAAYVVDDGYRAWRLGGFAELASPVGDIRLSAGAVRALDGDGGFYASLNLISEF